MRRSAGTARTRSGCTTCTATCGEWCLDGYDAGFYARSPRLDPVNLSTGAPYRVLRGGGFNDDASRARSAIRNENAPEVPVFVLGLRPARALEPPPAASPSSEE